MKIITIILIVSFVIYTAGYRVQHGYVDVYTGNSKGCTEYIFGIRGKEWHKDSPFYKRISKIKGFDPNKSKFISFNGTKYILFSAVEFSHGDPGVGIQLMGDDYSRAYELASDEEIYSLYDSLIKEDRFESRKKIDELFEKMLTSL